MILVVTLDNRVSKEIIIRFQILPSISSPVHILFLPSKIIIVVSQAQNELDPISSSLSYNKIQPLYRLTKEKQIRKFASFEDLKNKQRAKMDKDSRTLNICSL